MKTSVLGKLMRLVQKHLTACGTAATNCESETAKDDTAGSHTRKMPEPPADADFLFYYDGSNVLLKPQNSTARKHLEGSVAEYARWLVRFYLCDGSTILLRKQGTDAFFVKPGGDLATLTDTLVKRRFTVVKDDTMKKAEPPADADFLFYYDGSNVLVKPQNATARKHFEDNVAEYHQWLVIFYRPGGNELLGRNGAFFVKPECSLYSLATLADTLAKRGFTVVNDETMKKPEPPADADFLFYYEGPKILLRPQNLRAREHLQTTLGGDAARWVNAALAVKDTSVVPLAHKLVAAGFVVVGQSALVKIDRLYVNKGEWRLYTGGRATPRKLIDQIFKGAGTPN
jgi:hypothetical protein